MNGPIGTLPIGLVEPGALPAVALLAAEQASVTDQVLLVEVEASDRPGTVEPTPWPALGTQPIGVRPGPVISGTIVLRWSDRDWTSRPDDTRPNLHLPGRVGEWSLERTIPLRPDGERRVAQAVAALGISNADGAGDAYADGLAVDGYPVRVSLLPSRAARYAEARLVFDGVGAGWRTQGETLRLLARDQGYRLEVPLLGLYGGTGGADGTADMAGLPIMEIHGIVRTVTPQLVDPARQIYRFHARAAAELLAVYDAGAPVTLGVARAGYAALDATAPAGGTYDFSLSAEGSFFRLGSNPGGAVFCDARGDATGGYVAALPAIMRRLLSRAVVPIEASSFASAEAWAPGAAGIVFSAQLSIGAAVTQVAAGAALYWGDDGTGRISVGRLAAPVQAGLMFDQRTIVGEVEELDPPPTLWRLRMGYRRNWTTLSATDVVPAPTITEARRMDLIQPERVAVVADVPRRAQYLLAEDLAMPTLYDNEADAAGLGANLLSLYAPQRRVYRVPVGTSGYGVTLGQSVRVQWPRLGLAAGRDVRVLGQVARGSRVDLLVVG